MATNLASLGTDGLEALRCNEICQAICVLDYRFLVDLGKLFTNMWFCQTQMKTSRGTTKLYFSVIGIKGDWVYLRKVLGCNSDSGGSTHSLKKVLKL